jgi:pimeloyl-ACP methyl ester carboxylesterase
MPKVLVNGVHLHYQQVGEVVEGRQHLVMLHGLASNLAFWYFQYAQVFADRFRVTLLDLRGHGGSDMPPSGYSPADHAMDVGELLDHLKIEQAHFVAHSFGGLVTLHHAKRRPGAVRSLVLVDSHLPDLCVGAPNGTWPHGNSVRSVLQRHGIDLDPDDPHFGLRLLGAMARLRMSEQPIPEELLRLFGPVMDKFGRHTASQWLKLLGTTTAETEAMGNGTLGQQELREFEFPIIAIYGEGSHARRTGDELRELWPEAEFRLVRGAGHFFPVARAQELIAQCNRFWDDCEKGERRRVRRPNDKRAYFQSDRFYTVEGAWYCAMRDRKPLGPFESQEEAARELAALLAAS